MPTPDGTYLSVEKANPVRMIGGGKKGSPGYYNELVNWAVRFTYSGDYYHSAPWSVVNQGTSNVSHGCVNLAPEDAQIYYNLAVPGNPITITSSPKAGKWDDGWTQWFLSWSQYPGRQRHPHGGPGWSARQQLREAVIAPRGHRAGSPWHLGREQLQRGVAGGRGRRSRKPFGMVLLLSGRTGAADSTGARYPTWTAG